jgi:diguanylate cyclase (GGDEF)-like protein
MDILVRPDTVSFVSHITVTLLFAGLFAFEYRETRHVYFQYWTMTWVLLCASLLLRLGWMMTGRSLFLVSSGLLQLAFAASLLFAGGAVTGRGETHVSSLALLIPALGGALYAVGILAGVPGSHTLRGLLLLGLFAWNFIVSRRLWKAGPGSGRKIYSVSLLWGAALALHDVVVYAAAELPPPTPVSSHLRYHDTYYVVLETFLAFSAMMMWMEAQNDQLRRANEELDQSRRQLALTAQTDPLTGLFNRTALNETCEADNSVSGIVAVLDLDNFKDINDALGHLVGDEVLASVGNLIRSSIRKTDHAWRWGGDEFVILFQDQNQAAARERLQSLEQHLQRFRIRGRGVLPVGVSWGTAEVAPGASLRQAIEEADQRMYLRKKDKISPSKFFGE